VLTIMTFRAAACIAAVAYLLQTGDRCMAQPSPPSRTAAATQAADVVLNCRPNRAGNRLVFPYSLTNHSGADIYVMDAIPGIEPQTVDRNTAVIWLGGDGWAHVMKGIAPLPPDMLVEVRVIPFVAKLPAGGQLERTLEVPLPIAEVDPYHPDLPLRDYDLIDIEGVVLTVEFLRSTVEGFGAEPVPEAPDLYRVRGKYTVGQVERVSCSLPSRKLQMLKRRDNFPRPD
jgi:hypothetical protein